MNKYDLLSNIISLINSSEFVSTIETLADECNVPLPYMRSTLLTLLKNNIVSSRLSTVDDDYSDDYYFMEDYYGNTDVVAQKILDGEYDDLEWQITLNILNADEDEILPLSHIEYGAIKALGENLLSIKQASLFEKKDTVNPISPNIRKNIETIQEAIELKKEISFSYKNSKGETEQRKIYPYTIITNVNDNWIYVQSTEGKNYRLDRILHYCSLINDSDPYPKITINPNQKYVWGTYFNEGLTPTHVKLRISDETSNLLGKIKRDIERRKETCKFYQKDNYYYYEDDIIGMDEFQRWVRSYGSSIIVLEPEELKKAIVTRAKETLSNYKLAKKWKNL